MKYLYRQSILDKMLNRPNTGGPVDEGDVRKHLELDLRVHQIELEMQNQELKQAQHALEISRDRYAALYDFSPIGFITLDRCGVIKELNLAAAALLGLAPSQLLDRRFFKFIHKNDQLKFQRFLNRCQQAETAIPVEIKMATDQGQLPRILELHGHVLPIALDEAGACQIAIMDITERHQAKEVLDKSHHELEERVKERTAELLNSNQALAKADQELKELSFHLQQVREEERAQMAREIHDELGGILTAIKYDLCAATRQSDNVHQEGADRSSMAIALIDSAIHALRRIITYLRPSILDEVGLWAALEWQAQEFQEQTGIPCTFKLNGEERALPPDQATAVFRIVQEALTNIAKHAEASETHILARVTRQEITIKIQDNGKGITREQVWNSRSFGIRGMQERARAFIFSVRLSQNSDAGTTVTLKIPLVQS